MAEPVAVLVDGDNISGIHASRILAVAAQQGGPTVARVYLDAQRASDWHGALGLRLFHAGTGKNAADILLALDAMELTLSRGVRGFVIASSDGDFTHLAIRLRELGAKVIGVGEKKAPKTFRASCTEFIELGTQIGIGGLDQKIHAMIAANSKKGAGIRITDLAAKMHAEHGIQISEYPEKTWRAYLKARPALFDLDPRGPDAAVRFRLEGFAQAA